MKKRIDITTTATLRPEILSRTLQTFAKYLFNNTNIEYRLIINIDLVGHKDCSPLEVVKIARNYFSNVVYRIGETPSFPIAFKWVWDQVSIDADYVFHLEDDWALLRFVSIQNMIDLLEKYPDLMILRLSAFTATEKTLKNWNRFYPWNGEFYECPENLIGGMAFAGHPSLIKANWVRHVRCDLNGVSNPEKQLKWRDKNIGPYLTKFMYGVFSEQNIGPTIADIGRRWMINNNWRKAGSKACFKEWVKYNEVQGVQR